MTASESFRLGMRDAVGPRHLPHRSCHAPGRGFESRRSRKLFVLQRRGFRVALARAAHPPWPPLSRPQCPTVPNRRASMPRGRQRACPCPPEEPEESPPRDRLRPRAANQAPCAVNGLWSEFRHRGFPSDLAELGSDRSVRRGGVPGGKLWRPRASSMRSSPRLHNIRAVEPSSRRSFSPGQREIDERIAKHHRMTPKRVREAVVKLLKRGFRPIARYLTGCSISA